MAFFKEMQLLKQSLMRPFPNIHAVTAISRDMRPSHAKKGGNEIEAQNLVSETSTTEQAKHAKLDHDSMNFIIIRND
jgi:hypothetical protein